MLAVATVAEMLYADLHANLAEIGILRALGAREIHIVSSPDRSAKRHPLSGGRRHRPNADAVLFPLARATAPVLTLVECFMLAWLMSFAAGIVGSLVPAWTAVQVSPAEAMREGNR